MAPTLTILLALHLPAAAFAPDGGNHQGVEPQRLHVVHPQVQAALDRSPGWQAFVAAEGEGWSATWDEALGTPRRLRGPGVPLPTHDADAIADAFVRWLEPHAQLLGFEPNTLAVRDARYVRRLDTWYLDVDVLVSGLTAWRGGITGRVKEGRLIDVGIATYPGVPLTGDFHLSARGASRRAIAAGPAPGAQHTDTSSTPRLLPLESLQGIELRRVWEVRSRTEDPPGRWVSFVDGATGELLSVHNEVRFLDGQVLGEHDIRSPADGLTISPMPLVEVATAEGALTTAATDGTFTIDETAELVTDLHGDYAQIHNEAGSDAVLAGPGPDLLWTSADATQAEIDAYVFLHHARDWGAAVAPEVPIVDGTVDAYVNIDQACNAYFDGDVNFFEAGYGCNNTARIADVVYHEWGHGFHLWSIESTWIGFDGSLSEGAADTVSFLMTGDHRIAPGFYTSGQEIRDVDNEARYPEDFVASDYYVHSNGLIFGGAMWDLWNLLVAEQGDEAGTATAAAIFAGLLKGGPDIPTAFDEALVADDDNGNLADGTPNECAIVDAFGLHGLGPLGNGSPYIAFHEPVTSVAADTDIPLRFELESASPLCVPYDPVAAVLHYRIDAADWQTAAATLDDLGASATIPGQPLGVFVEYWLEVEDASGAVFRAPRGGDIHPYSFYSGGVLEVWCHDFEEDDGGFKHRLLDGSDGEGADDWQWGKPNGLSGDPSAAFSGAKVWGNDLGHDEFNGAYQDSKHNRLRSPVVDLLHYDDVFLHYQRWLNVEDGVYDEAYILADEELVWTNHASTSDDGREHHLDNEWMAHAVPLGTAVADGEVQLEWHLESDGGLAFGGWTLDDVCLLAPDTPDNRLGIHDFDAVDVGGSILLSWTNPVHEPVAEVVVVRSFDRWPAGPHDGEVVYRDTDPQPGAAMQRGDLVDTAYYAVYASDGSAWLSWTREGLNADAVLAEGGDNRAAAAAHDRAAGCGCSQTGPALGWPALAVLGLLLRRRGPGRSRRDAS